ncbi:hypothetical protein [Candidatus Poriferisodalis sp.]|uniref:hypothetical protein n=1 Tax=Candidatus Poriferisodalis sp. TaxID=3101277 RepID=UPI003B024D61
MTIAIIVTWRILRPFLADWLDMSTRQVSYLVVAITLATFPVTIWWERRKRRRLYLRRLAEHRSQGVEGD